MNAQKEIIELDRVITQIKALRASLLKVDKLSEKVSKIHPSNSIPNQVNKAALALNAECGDLDRIRQKTWRTIKENEYLDVSLEDKEYHPSSWYTSRT